MTKTQEDAARRMAEAVEHREVCADETLCMRLWETLEVFQNEPFYTAKNLKFSYYLKGNEMFVTRKEKTITKASVMLAFRRALELGGVVSGPKKLGTFGASYLYPVFLRIGVIRKSQ